MTNQPLLESENLLSILLNEQKKELIERAVKEIKENPENYNIDFFWEFDSSIGGIGGYCMPFDPTINPFPTGIGRSLFRPLQYSASDIEINKDIYFHARHAVQDAGLHVEMASGYVFYKFENKFSRFVLQFKKHTLGQFINEFERKNLQPHLIDSLKLFLKLYNKSKHIVNQDEERERLFSPADALISYISARIIGKELLRPYYDEILNSIGEYINRLNGLNMKL